MKMTKLLSTSLLTLFVTVAAPGAALAADSRAEQSSFVPAPEGAKRGSELDQRRYAARAAASREARNYRGGDTVVISASALAIVLLIVLVIILL